LSVPVSDEETLILERFHDPAISPLTEVMRPKPPPWSRRMLSYL
jgi:hypothetical protein